MKRVKLGVLAVLAAVAAAAFAAAPASAVHGTMARYDPQTSNVPYLAWRGEELRLVKCSGDINTDAPGEGQSVDWIVEDWSGYPFQPPSLESSTVRFFTGTGEHAEEGCVKADFVSLKAGLAMIKLVISDDDTGNPILKHQFLAGWLSLNTPTIREVASADDPGGGGALGDPDGDGDLVAGGLPGRVQIHVTGTLPLGNNFTELGLPAAIQLPAEDADAPDAGDGDTTTYWDDLAAALATTSDARPFYRDAPWRMWDIHDDRTAREGHVNPVSCNEPASTHTALDAVDACLGAITFIGDGAYSRSFGDLSLEPTWGPYDPKRPDETLLPDGKVDAGDVPMPAAKIEVAIAPNQGGTDIGGVGSLTVVDDDTGIDVGVYKCIPYTRDHRCTSLADNEAGFVTHPATTPRVILGGTPGDPEHNHYAPFYSRWIPATAAPAAEASGTDGPSLGNNFPGYRAIGTNEFGGGGLAANPNLYDYWQPTELLSVATAGDTDCLEFIDFEPNPDRHVFRQTPEGPQRIIVYNDEHGEAQVYFNPGTGFFFDNLGARNLNPGCDLRDIDVLGTADITATARYPYQKTTDPDKTSAVLTKRVHSLWNKDVDCVPKGPIPPIENGLAFICTATATDITGDPLVGEIVCFMTNGEGMREFPLGVPFFKDALHRLCVFTDENGEASVEVFGKCAAGNVIAEFLTEGGLIRFDTFTFACPPGGAGGTSAGGTSSGGSALPAGVDPASITPGVPTQQTQQVIQQAKADQAKPESKPAAKPKKATLAFSRIDKRLGKPTRYVVVRVNAAAKTARVQVTLIGKSGKVLGKVVRRVPTNRVVRVPNLKLPKAVKTARVKVLA